LRCPSGQGTKAVAAHLAKTTVTADPNDDYYFWITGDGGAGGGGGGG
jgi:hypothetical protein